ncbi:MAG: hypothetical protein HOQ36_18290 [Nocardia sp.]|nr:hypothetical protein [Nocardia sp.]
MPAWLFTAASGPPCAEPANAATDTAATPRIIANFPVEVMFWIPIDRELLL